MTEKKIFLIKKLTQRNTHETWLLYQCPLVKEAGSDVDVYLSTDDSAL